MGRRAGGTARLPHSSRVYEHRPRNAEEQLQGRRAGMSAVAHSSSRLAAPVAASSACVAASASLAVRPSAIALSRCFWSDTICAAASSRARALCETSSRALAKRSSSPACASASAFNFCESAHKRRGASQHANAVCEIEDGRGRTSCAASSFLLLRPSFFSMSLPCFARCASSCFTLRSCAALSVCACARRRMSALSDIEGETGV